MLITSGNCGFDPDPKFLGKLLLFDCCICYHSLYSRSWNGLNLQVNLMEKRMPQSLSMPWIVICHKSRYWWALAIVHQLLILLYFQLFILSWYVHVYFLNLYTILSTYLVLFSVFTICACLSLLSQSSMWILSLPPFILVTVVEIKGKMISVIFVDFLFI